MYVQFCEKCHRSWEDEKQISDEHCPECNGALVYSGYLVENWVNLSKDEKCKIKEEFFQKEEQKEEIEEVQNSDVSGVGLAIKIVASLVMVLSCIGSFVIMSKSGFAVGFAMLLVCVLTGLLAFGIGEICSLLASINSKMDSMDK